ncbi:MAG: energy-coupled thiamine transporter ThiT [Oscillospiraceae bacterium]|nr:energy-coupled thiamine transporter ThiT [Oscillospiraceae bacterium]
MHINNKTKTLTECAVMVALATVLSLIPIYQAPYGGTVTLGSMVPMVVLCIHIKDFRWGLLACFAYSLIQMMFGFTAPPTATLGYFIAVVMLDYIVAFTVICLVNPLSKLLGNSVFGVSVATAFVVLIRFMCHFTTGILIWGVYAPEGQPVWLYSLLYNGGYMLPELVITVVLAAAIYAVMSKRKR